jgi:hypothetical protein
MTEKPIYLEQAAQEHDEPAALPGAAGHDEWILDEAIEETFPASDPTSPHRPESSLAMKYQYKKRR